MTERSLSEKDITLNDVVNKMRDVLDAEFYKEGIWQCPYEDKWSRKMFMNEFLRARWWVFMRNN